MYNLSGSWGKIACMNQTPFPKPPPAAPLPLEVWLDQTDRAEVGREPFFRGRDREYEVFRRAANSLRAGRTGGSTMIFQGAPGAGKSALMGECMEAVRLHSTPEAPWVAVSINPGSLRFPDQVVRSMVRAANAEGQRLREQASGAISGVLEGFLNLGRQLLREIPERDLSLGGVSWSKREREVSAEGLFCHVASFLAKFHIVVFVDEAQNTPAGDTTRDVLDCLHRASQGIPVVAAFFGLSDTQDVLRQCGLSRFARGRVVNLEPLDYEDAACAIGDALAAYDFTGDSQQRETWVERLAELSQGWPQHINSVSVAASSIIRDNDYRIDAGHLHAAMTVAEEYKQEYYAGRLAAGSQDPAFYKQLALAVEDTASGSLPRAELQRLAAPVLENSTLSFDDLLTDALHAGLLSPIQELPYHYRIPIPSFADYLRALPVDPLGQ